MLCMTIIYVLDRSELFRFINKTRVKKPYIQICQSLIDYLKHYHVIKVVLTRTL